MFPSGLSGNIVSLMKMLVTDLVTELISYCAWLSGEPAYKWGFCLPCVQRVGGGRVSYLILNVIIKKPM